MFNQDDAFKEIIDAYPGFLYESDTYYDDSESPEILLCFELMNFGRFLWRQSALNTNFDFKPLVLLIKNLLLNGNKSVVELVVGCLMEELNQLDTYSADSKLTARWITDLGPLLEERHLEWRKKIQSQSNKLDI